MALAEHIELNVRGKVWIGIVSLRALSGPLPKYEAQILLSSSKFVLQKIKVIETGNTADIIMF